MLIFFKRWPKYSIDLEAYLEICYHLIQNVYVYKTKIRHFVKNWYSDHCQWCMLGYATKHTVCFGALILLLLSSMDRLGFSIRIFARGQTPFLGGQILSFCIDFNATCS